MKPKRIILVRHAESVGNIDKSHYSHTPDFNIPLSQKGHKQSIEAGKQISNLVDNGEIYAYVSPFLRTRQTFEGINSLLSRKIVKHIEDPRIREQDWGHFKNSEVLKTENSKRKAFGKFYYRLEDGESGADVFDRVNSFIDTLHRDFKKTDYPDNALIVTHGVTLGIFLMRWFHWSVEDWQEFPNPKNAQIITINLENNSIFSES